MGCSSTKPAAEEPLCTHAFLADYDYDVARTDDELYDEDDDGDRAAGSLYNEKAFEELQLALLDSSSAILAGRAREADALISFLPPTTATSPLALAFSAAKDGWSLATLYAKISGMQPLVLLVRSLGSGAIVGVYIAESISPPHCYEVRGDGTTFVFRLDEPCRKHRWVGIGDADCEHADFALCSKDNMTFGCTALSIADNLYSCSTGHSPTFASAPLLSGDACTVRERVDFEADMVEVFTTRTALDKAAALKANSFSA